MLSGTSTTLNPGQQSPPIISDQKKKQEHRRLANVVKGVHADLRKKYRQSK